MRRRVVLGGLVLLVILPSAAAMRVEGALVLRGSASFPEGTELDGSLLGLYWNDTRGLRGLAIEAERVVVHEYESRSMMVGTTQVILDTEGRRYTLTEARIVAAGGEAGWLGIYGGGSTALLGRGDAGGSRVTPVGEGHLGGAPFNPEPRPDPSVDYSSQTFSFPHATWEGAGEIELERPRALKIKGLDLDVRSRENATMIATGKEMSGPAGTDRRDRWVLLELTEAKLHLEAATPFQAASENLLLRWSGRATLESLSGTLQASSGSYQASPATPSVLDGTFQAALESVETHEGVVGALTLAGDMSATSMATLQAPPAAAPGKPALFLLGAALGIAGASGLALALRHRASRFSVDECAQLAREAAEQERYIVALAWTRRALEHAPRSARLLADAGFYLACIGDVEGALAEYTAASRLSESGEPDYLAARLLASTGAPAERVREWLEVALLRAPTLAFEVEEDAAFGGVREEAWLEAALAQARQRAGAA